MALSWSAWHYAGNNGMRVGIDAHSGSGVDTNSGSFSFLVNYWTGNQYNYNDNMVLTYTNGSLSFNNTQSSGTSTQRVTNAGYTHTYTTWGPGSAGTYTVSCSISGAYNGSTPSHSVAVAIPERPYAAPSAPTGVTATRNSDSQVTVAGTHPSSGQRPVSTMTIQMRTYTGSTWSGWSTVYTGTGTSKAITGLSANHIYDFQMRLNNSVGSSAFVAAAAYVYMTPAAPSSVAANVSGPNVVVTWASSAYTSSTVTHKVQRKIGAGAWTDVASGIVRATLTWTDTAPGGGTNYYRVATVTSSGSLSSSWVEANSVVTADCWVWDGEDTLPAHMTLWNGSAEVPLSVDQQLAQ